MLNFFTHFDIERRFMLIVGIEILHSQFELKVPPTLRSLRKNLQQVSLARLRQYGRDSTIEQYFGRQAYNTHLKAEEVPKGQQDESMAGSSCSSKNRSLSDAENPMEESKTTTAKKAFKKNKYRS